MSRMPCPGGDEGGGAASERAAHEDPRGDAQLGAEEAHRAANRQDRTLAGMSTTL